MGAPTIRTANRALVARDGRLLVTVNQHEGTRFHLLPGGGQDFGEDRVAAVRREVLEETGLDVVVDGLACLRSYIGANHRFAAADAVFHQEEAIWWCHLTGQDTSAEGVPGQPVLADEFQTGIAWLTPQELRAGDFSPMPLLEWLEIPEDERPLYLGDCL